MKREGLVWTDMERFVEHTVKKKPGSAQAYHLAAIYKEKLGGYALPLTHMCLFAQVLKEEILD